MAQPTHDPSATLAEIRAIMLRSTRFISLSGLSGVATGIIALLGAGILYAKLYYSYHTTNISQAFMVAGGRGEALFRFLLTLALGMIVVGLLAGIYFTTRRARLQGKPIWDSSAKRLVINLAIPLTAGGIFCLLLFWHGAVELIMPSMLVFYGMAMLHASKYTVDELRHMGMSEVALGLISGFWTQHALLIWAVGFGVFPILYGLMMYNRYERNTPDSNPKL